jgi:hypothetical protein
VIVVDTPVLAYAVGGEHPLKRPSTRLVEAVAAGTIEATTTVDVIQEFAHIQARRRSGSEVAALARDFTELLSPLLMVDRGQLERGLTLFERHRRLGCFDAILAAAALAAGAQAFVSADRAFSAVPRLPFVELGGEELEKLLGPA